jgi:HlyD family secretion protein
MKKTFFYTGLVLLAIAGLIVFNQMSSKKGNKASIFTQVGKGTFEITVTAAGELIPEKSVDIRGPEIAQSNQQDGGGGGGNRGGGGGGGRGSDMHFADLKIQDIVPEGTIVNQGDYVAQLDRTSFDNTLKDELQNLVTLRANLEMKILDTAVVLTNLRDGIKNQRYTVEEADLTLQQSKYEPPATIRQAELALEREKRALSQLQKSYKLRVAQTLTEINTVKLTLTRRLQLVSDLEQYLSKFTIKAPASGMVIYKKDRNGSKRKAGSSVNAFDLVVATLPDLTTMISKIYVNEIEVSKVQPGQNVDIVVDAIPKNAYKGKVMSIANVGEVLPNSDAKMFETQIKIDGTDPNLRPSMTTGNKIIIKSIDNAIFIPNEAIQTGPDSIPFVYKKNRTKQVVLLGESNDKNSIVEKGLTAGTTIYLVPPENSEKFKLVGENLIPIIKDRQKTSRLENEKYKVQASSKTK